MGTRKFIDLSNTRIGRLVVKGRAGYSSDGKILWDCLCDCGNKVVRRRACLRNESSKSCGCYRKELHFKDLTNKVFGRLQAINISGQKGRKFIWKCRCECGNIVDICGSDLLTGHTQSCGCLQRERSSDAAVQRNKRLMYCVSKSCSMFLDIIQNEFGVAIEREFRIKNRLFDGKIADILLEIDGTYWHNLNPEIDIIKDKLALDNGYCIIRMNINSIYEVSKKFTYYKDALLKAFILHNIIKGAY